MRILRDTTKERLFALQCGLVDKKVIKFFYEVTICPYPIPSPILCLFG